MKKLIVILFLNLIPVIGFTQNQGYYPYRKLEPQKLQEDFQLLVSSLKEGHAGLYNYLDKKDFENYVSQIKEHLKNPMDETEFYIVLSEFLAQIRCGHTYVLPSKKFKSFSRNYLLSPPFSCLVKKNNLYLNHILFQSNYLSRGQRIISINGIPSEQIIQRCLKVIHADGMTQNRKNMLLGQNFQFYFKMIYGNSNYFKLRVDSVGRIQDISFSAQPVDTLSKYYHRDYNEKTPTITKTFYNNGRTPYLHLHSFKKNDTTNLKKELKAFFREVNKKNCDSLILDLRNNYGGETTQMIEALRYLHSKPFKPFLKVKATSDSSYSFLTYTKDDKKFLTDRVKKNHLNEYVWQNKKYLKEYKPYKRRYIGHIQVLINEGTFSGASHLASILKDRPNTTYYGSETGGNAFISNAGISANLVLKHTELEIHIPLLKGVYAVNHVDKPDRGVFPDYHFIPTIREIVTNKDVLLEKVLNNHFKPVE